MKIDSIDKMVPAISQPGDLRSAAEVTTMATEASDTQTSKPQTSEDNNEAEADDNGAMAQAQAAPPAQLTQDGVGSAVVDVAAGGRHLGRKGDC